MAPITPYATYLKWDTKHYCDFLCKLSTQPNCSYKENEVRAVLVIMIFFKLIKYLVLCLVWNCKKKRNRVKYLTCSHYLIY